MGGLLMFIQVSHLWPKQGKEGWRMDLQGASIPTGSNWPSHNVRIHLPSSQFHCSSSLPLVIKCFCSLSLILFLIFPLHIYCTIVVVPPLLDILFSLMLLFYLHFRFGNSHGHFLKFSDFFPSTGICLLMSPLKAFFISVTVFLIYSIFF